MGADELATWPSHLVEHFVVVVGGGLWVPGVQLLMFVVGVNECGGDMLWPQTV